MTSALSAAMPIRKNTMPSSNSRRSSSAAIDCFKTTGRARRPWTHTRLYRAAAAPVRGEAPDDRILPQARRLEDGFGGLLGSRHQQQGLLILGLTNRRHASRQILLACRT